MQTITEEEEICGNINSSEQNPLPGLICVFSICALHITFYKSILQKIMMIFHTMHLSVCQSTSF